MTLGILAVIVGTALAVSLALDWRRAQREARELDARLEAERAEWLTKFYADQKRAYEHRQSFSGWPFPPRGDD